MMASKVVPIKQSDWLNELVKAQGDEKPVTAPSHAITVYDYMARTGVNRKTANDRLNREVQNGVLKSGWKLVHDSLDRQVRMRAYWPAE
jgi:hypothetical protein